MKKYRQLKLKLFYLTTVVQSEKIPVIDLYISRMFLNYFELQGAIFFLGNLKLTFNSSSLQ